ncbi:MAG: ADP-glyceromanno-heptose 6-epimerase [Bacteroidota bacterium]
MIVVTGAAGFIGSNMLVCLNRDNYRDIILVDDFSRIDKSLNFASAVYSGMVERNEFFSWLADNHRFVQFVIHIGARTDTAEFDRKVFNRLNLEYSKQVWKLCVEFGLPLIYASSAATYGDGSLGYSDDHALVHKLLPLNPYGESKNEFDKWVLEQEKKPFFWAGFKFFNVYGPNEYHKGRMASVVFHAYNQIKGTGRMKLFRSHKQEFAHGEQKRDFIYVKDVTDVIKWFMENRKQPGIYNLGTGIARTFNDLVKGTFTAMNIAPAIDYIDTPPDIRDKYQYFTEADMRKLRSAGYNKTFFSLEDGIHEYVTEYLQANRHI